MGLRRSAAWLGLLLLGCKGEKPAEESAEPKKVRCATASSRAVTPTVELRGGIAPLPDRDALVAPQVAGRIIEVKVREGDRVIAGQLLARIDASSLEDQGREAEAALARARAERESAEAALARVKKVFEHGIVARQEVDDAQLKVASARAQEAEAAGAAQRAHRQTAWASVHSPLDGAVLKLLRRSGELVDGTPATPIAEVADLSSLEMVADATAQQLMQIKKDAHATISSDWLPGVTWTGTVAAVAVAVDRASGLGPVRIRLDLGQGARPPAGVLSVGRIEVGEPHPAVFVPKQAIKSAGGAEFEVIECGANGVAHAHKIHRGVEQNGEVEVQNELTAGAWVLIDPVLGVADGDKIEAEK